MPWKVAYSPEKKIIEYRLAGTITLADLEIALREGLTLSKRHGCFLFYVDALEVVPKVTMTDLFVFPKLFVPLGVPNTARIAVFRPVKDVEQPMQRFCETVFFNNNYQIKFFEDPGPALRWLGVPEIH